MDGKRYAVGLAGGLLFALIIVGGSMVPLFTASQATSGSNQLSSFKATSTTTTSTGSAAQLVGGNATNGVPVPQSTTTTSAPAQTSTASETGGLGLFALLSGNQQGSRPSSAASLAALTAQSPSQDLLVLLPILGAVLLGALIYRTAVMRANEGSG